MAQVEPVSDSVAVAIDNDSRRRPFRHSLQPKSTPAEISAHIRRSTSIGSKRPHHNNNIKRPTVPDIPESEKPDEEPTEDGQQAPGLAAVHCAPDNSRISFTKKLSHASRASKRSSVQSVASHSERNGGVVSAAAASGACVNAAYTGSALSTRSSSLHGSMSSLPVMREQYCCCQRWTRLEKNLAIIVACLALVIICLIAVIGIVTKYRDTPLNTYFLPLKF